MRRETESESAGGTLVAEREVARRPARPTVAWYGGSWVYSNPDPEPPPKPRDRAAERAERRAKFDAAEFGPERKPGEGTGLVLGRFQPPHLGHQYLVDFARNFVSQLLVLVRVGPDDTIPMELLQRWLPQMFPDVRTVFVREDKPLPVGPGSGQRDRWPGIIRQHTGTPDFLFASDAYEDVARAIGARFVPVDPDRRAVPVSGRKIRADPLGHWEYLPPPVRPYYVKRVCIVGPESTRKTTLAQRLARHYKTVATDEYARVLYGERGEDWAPADTQLIARGQFAAEEAAARLANRVLFCDTNPATVRLWSERLFGKSPTWLATPPGGPYHLYLVTEPDVPFAGDIGFHEPEARRAFLDCVLEMVTPPAGPAVVEAPPVVRITGLADERFEKARAAVDALLNIKSGKAKKKA